MFPGGILVVSVESLFVFHFVFILMTRICFSKLSALSKMAEKLSTVLIHLKAQFKPVVDDILFLFSKKKKKKTKKKNKKKKTTNKQDWTFDVNHSDTEIQNC